MAERLSDVEHTVASRMHVRIQTAPDGPFDLHARLRDTQAFAVVIVEGTVQCATQLGTHSGLRLLGPGDLLSRPGRSQSTLMTRSDLAVSGPMRYAALDDRVLALVQRYPRLIEGLQMRADDQQQRLLVQLLICQLPRVEDRVLALMWLLAETWGNATPDGVVLAIRLTHSAIGLLVGARRSTVTLALKELQLRSALVRRKDDWLILERPQPVAAGS
ncbi:MAG: hypothetical protein WAL22_11355 [Solirubrobacteraceae bacterium]